MCLVHCNTTDKPKFTACLRNIRGNTSDASHGLETWLLPVQLTAGLKAPALVFIQCVLLCRLSLLL